MRLLAKPSAYQRFGGGFLNSIPDDCYGLVKVRSQYGVYRI